MCLGGSGGGAQKGPERDFFKYPSDPTGDAAFQKSQDEAAGKTATSMDNTPARPQRRMMDHSLGISTTGPTSGRNTGINIS